jgi:hypothetical protein
MLYLWLRKDALAGLEVEVRPIEPLLHSFTVTVF